MTSDRGNLGGAAANLHLTPPVPPKSAGLNPNASEFLSSKSASTQDVGAWNEGDGPTNAPIHPAINTSVYEFSNGSAATKVDKAGAVYTGDSAAPPFPNHVVQIVQPLPAAVTPLEYLPHADVVAGDMVPPAMVDGGSGSTTPHHTEEVVPCLDGTISDDVLRGMLRTQLDYYFSRENLAHDAYLISQMDSDHYVPIRTVAHFNQVKKLTTNMQLIVQILRELPTVQVDDVGEKVRPNHNRCIVILREIPESTPLEAVKNLFSGKSCPPYVSCEFAHNDSWYVTFDSDEDAQRAYQYLREDVRTFLNRPIMARIKAKPLVRSTFFPRNGVKQNFETVTYPAVAALPHPIPTVHAVSQQQAPAPSPVYPSYTSAAAVPTVQYVNTSAQQPFQFNHYPQLMAWQAAPAMLNPSMAFYYNDYQAESVKLSANPAPRPYPAVNRNRNPSKNNNRVNAAAPHQLEVANIRPQPTPQPPVPQPPPPPPPPAHPQQQQQHHQQPPRGMNAPSEPRIVIPAPERYPVASTAPPTIAIVASSHQQQVEAPPVIGGGNYMRRGEHSNAHHSTLHHSNISSHHPRHSNNNQPYSGHGSSSSHNHPILPLSTPTTPHTQPTPATSHAPHPKDPPVSVSQTSSRPAQRSYTSRRKRQDDDGAKNTKNSAVPASREHRAQQFQLQPNSFPPLPGFNTSTSSGDLHIENKLSDVVKGTNKPTPLGKDPGGRPHGSPMPPSTPPTPPKDSVVTPITPSTPSNSCSTNNLNNNKNIVMAMTEVPIFPENSLPTPPNSPIHRSPVTSLSTALVSPQTSIGVGSKPVPPHHHHKDDKDASIQQQHVINNSNSSSDEKPIKLSYAQMVRRSETAAAAAGDQSVVVNGDHSDSDSGGGQPVKSPNSNHSDQCQTNNRSGSTTRPSRDSDTRDPRMRRNIARDRRPLRERQRVK